MSTIKVDNLQTTSGVGLYPTKAWVNFNGTGTVAIRSSGGVSSVTDNGTGQAQINFSSSMPSVGYSTSAMSTRVSGNPNTNAGSAVNNLRGTSYFSTSSCHVQYIAPAWTFQDMAISTFMAIH